MPSRAARLLRALTETLWHDFKTLESANAFLDSERLSEVMLAAGVADEPVMWFTTPA